MTKQVTHVQLQGPIYIAGIGNITQQELVPPDPKQVGKFQNLGMELKEGFIEIKAISRVGVAVVFGIPLANIQCFVLAPDKK